MRTKWFLLLKILPSHALTQSAIVLGDAAALALALRLSALESAAGSRNLGPSAERAIWSVRDTSSVKLESYFGPGS